MTDLNEGVYSTAEVAQMFAVSPKTVSRWADLGWIAPLTTPGGHRRYLQSEVDRLRALPHRKAPFGRTVLETVVHEHFDGDAIAALLDLVARFGIRDQAMAELAKSTP